MHALVRGGQIRAVRMAEALKLASARLHRQDRPIAVPVAFGSYQIYQQPVSRMGRDIVQQERLAFAVYHKGIHAAIVVEVPDRQPTTDDRASGSGGHACAGILKSLALQAVVQDERLPVGASSKIH